ncbi:hypothetical protein BP6252_11220 [Coleophoma cylindrospora]|uniref:Extracellular membrane protein CFEM domain-containing protein n=1 Tax=Coleophoma cylindrospora TaxID=1849047 RepID=A0A3D8QPE4_9HELO|nr:hypothetical protein BP6252_11220 [Coleophoma cylindrospora]
MYSLTITTFVSLLSAAFLQITSAEPNFQHPDRNKILARRSSQDLSFCFGVNSICAVSNELFAQCGSFDNTQFYKCICGNGYVAVDEACYWCQLAYNLDISYAGASNKEGCSSAGVPIAPIPSSVQALEASFNATYTGVISGAGTTNTELPSSASATSTASTSFPLTSGAGASQSASSSLNTKTYNGGATSIVSLNGGSPITSTAPHPSSMPSSATLTPSTSKAVLGLGGAPTNTKIIMLGSIVALGVWVLF